MRTTLTIDPEIAERLRQEVALGKRPLKVIVNEALKRGLGLEAPVPLTGPALDQPVRRLKPQHRRVASADRATS